MNTQRVLTIFRTMQLWHRALIHLLIQRISNCFKTLFILRSLPRSPSHTYDYKNINTLVHFSKKGTPTCIRKCIRNAQKKNKLILQISSKWINESVFCNRYISHLLLLFCVCFCCYSVTLFLYSHKSKTVST